MSHANALKRKLPLIAGGVVLVAVIAFMVNYVVELVSGDVAAPKLVAQKITILSTPPPPPPPPPKQEEPPESKLEEKIDEPLPEPDPTPEAADDQPPAGDALGLDADGSAGGDGFGLLGRKGGRDLLAAAGGGGGAGRAEMARFGMAIKSDLHAYLAEIESIRSKAYDVSVKFWFDAQGQIKRYNVLGSTGNAKTDDSLKMALESYSRLPEVPPDEQTRSVTVRITSRI